MLAPNLWRITMQELSHYINGAHVKGTSSRFSDVYNPAVRGF